MTAAYDNTANNQGGFAPQGWPSGAAAQPGAGAVASRQMKQRNAVLVWLVWPILTLGIYHLVWYYKIHNEMLHFDPRQPIKPAGSLLTIMFGWIIIVPPFVSISTLEIELPPPSERRGWRRRAIPGSASSCCSSSVSRRCTTNSN